jgi:imidazolonepropionase-like amidohydrolase
MSRVVESAARRPVRRSRSLPVAATLRGLGAALVLALSAVSSSAETLLVTADTLYTSSDAGVIEGGAVLIDDGRIAAVGPLASMSVPAGTRTLEAAVVLPGLVDSHTLVGVSGSYNVDADQDGFEASDPAGARYRVLDSFNPRELLVNEALKLGTTTVHVTPRPTAPIAGSTAVFKTSGTVADEMLIRRDPAVLFNLGVAPKQAFGDQGGPGTRMATAALIRGEFTRAREWAAKDEDERDRDLGLEMLAKVLAGDALAVFTAHREDDIATALRLAREFDLRAVINYGTEAYLMRETLREHDATVVLAPPMQRATGMEKWNSTLEAAALLHDGDVPFVFATGYEAYVPKSRVLLWEVAMAVANGLPAETAVRAATIEPAELWGVADRVGSLEPGKDADLVLFDGDPFEYTTHIKHVVVGGEVVVEASR